MPRVRLIHVEYDGDDAGVLEVLRRLVPGFGPATPTLPAPIEGHAAEPLILRHPRARRTDVANASIDGDKPAPRESVERASAETSGTMGRPHEIDLPVADEPPELVGRNWGRGKQPRKLAIWTEESGKELTVHDMAKLAGRSVPACYAQINRAREQFRKNGDRTFHYADRNWRLTQDALRDEED